MTGVLHFAFVLVVLLAVFGASGGLAVAGIRLRDRFGGRRAARRRGRSGRRRDGRPVRR